MKEELHQHYYYYYNKKCSLNIYFHDIVYKKKRAEFYEQNGDFRNVSSSMFVAFLE